mgnify:CR=1 FL=1
MFNKSKNDNMTYGIVGLGRFGMALAIDLAESGSEIIALDSNEEKVQAIREYTENAFIVKNLEKKTLIETGAVSDSAYEVKSGIKAGDKIVSTPSSDYKEDTFEVKVK